MSSEKLFVFDLGMEDALWSKTMFIMIAFIYGILGIMFTAKYLHISGNMNKIECDPNVMTFMWMFSWIFGKSSEENIQKCMIQNKSVIDDYIESQVNAKFKSPDFKNMQTDIVTMNKNIDDLQKNYDGVSNKASDLAVGIQKNIKYMKEGMQKIIAAAIVQSRISSGMMSVVSNLNKTK